VTAAPDRTRTPAAAPAADASSLAQGDLRLLQTALAQELLDSRIPARVAFTGHDGDPRVFPTHFLWTGDELVLGTYAGAYKIKAMRARPRVAVTIDTEGFPPRVLQIRGTATVTDVEGLVPEYAAAMRRHVGGAQAERFLREADQPGLRMARIAIRPTWVGLLDFERRLPRALGGITA
jgi:hypothetical protein